MFTTDLVNLYNRNILKTSLYIYILQDEKCRLMHNLSLSMVKSKSFIAKKGPPPPAWFMLNKKYEQYTENISLYIAFFELYYQSNFF